MRWLIAAGLLVACGANRTPAEGPDGGPTVFDCWPNLDGRIDADELPVALGVSAEYWVSPDGTSVDLVGAEDELGLRVWDYSAESATDQRALFVATPLLGQWHAGSFPGGQFVLVTDGVDAVYSRDDRGLWLHGLASVDPSPASGTTLLVYDDPVGVLRFPLAPGMEWTDVGTITGGELDGLPYNGTDTYEVEVDALGRLELPYVAFSQTHRVRTQVTVAPAVGGVSVVRRQVSFMFECFGEVARATSRDNEPLRDFTVAAELRRFAL